MRSPMSLPRVRGAGDSKFLRRFGYGELRRRIFWVYRTFTATKIGEQEKLWRQLFLGLYFFPLTCHQLGLA